YPTKRPRQYSERQLQFFSSSGKKEGAVTSPDFPSAYPPLTRVIYRTCGLDFAGDRLLIFDGYGADFSNRVSARCGSRSVDDFWSEGRYLTLEFRSDGVVGPGELGFAATYRSSAGPLCRRSRRGLRQRHPSRSAPRSPTAAAAAVDR
uniref:CUB domain-containing protein n=1 Tax=Macrostomum lignano TaxID=282301 RepID=A0A1I8F3A8_9PLAT